MSNPIPNKPNYGQLKSLIQTTICSILPIITMKCVNTGDRTLDNIITTFVTGFIGIITIFFLSYDFGRILSRDGGTGFITDADDEVYNTIDFNSTDRLPVYINTVDILSPKENLDVLLWINKHTKTSSKPRYELSAQIHYPFRFKHNKAGMSYPFYRISNDVIHYDISNSDEQLSIISLRFSSKQITSIEYLFKILKEQNICSVDIDEIRKCVFDHLIPSTPKKLISYYNVIYNWSVKDDTVVKIGSYKTTRTFDQLFFTDKVKLLNILTKFKNDKMYPKHIGNDNKIGMCVHGPPGTGKSSLAVAVANYLNRNILNVDMSQIKTCKQFDELLIYVDSRGYIVFMDEIDCILGVLKTRSDKSDHDENKHETSDEYNHLMNLYVNTQIPEHKKEILEKIEKYKEIQSNQLTLGYILQKLDGINDTSGRVIIACTNHYKLIDPALLRAGRLGISLELSYCTVTMIVDILCFYLSIENKRQHLMTLKYKTDIAPADLIQYIQENYINEGCLDDVLRHIVCL